MRLVEALNGRTLKWLAEKTDISESTLGDYVRKGISRADYAVKIARALDRSVEWLVTGRDTARKSALMAAEEADWVEIDEYDLRELTDVGKGPPHNASPFRRDWLNQTLGTASGLWLARLLSDYPAAGLAEGGLVFCVDVTPAELLEGQLCLFRVNGGLIVGRFSYRTPGAVLAAGDRLGEAIVTSSEIGAEEGRYIPVARILGSFIRRL